jgi:hypothetical protein
MCAARRSADANGSGELDMEEFVAAFKGELQLLFHHCLAQQHGQTAATAEPCVHQRFDAATLQD